MLEIGDTQFRIGLALAPHTKFPVLTLADERGACCCNADWQFRFGPGHRSKAAEPKPGGFLFLVGKPECRQLRRDGPTRLRRLASGLVAKPERNSWVVCRAPRAFYWET